MKPHRPSPCQLLTLGLLLIPLSGHAQSNGFLDLSLALHSDDNITRGFLSSDLYSDQSLETTLTGGRFSPLPSGRSISVFGSVGATRLQDLTGLNSNNFGLGGSLEQKFGLGAYAPAMNASLQWLRHDSHSPTRERDLLEFELSYRKRLSVSWDFAAGVVYELSEGLRDAGSYASAYSDDNDVFDYSQFSAFSVAAYTFSNSSTLSLNYNWVDGHTVSSALAPNPQLLAIAKALTLDGAVKPPPGRQQVAYTLKSHAHLLSLDWSFPLGSDTSLTAGVSRQHIKAGNGVDYANERLSLTLLHVLQ
jgi:hypothetical protein